MGILIFNIYFFYKLYHLKFRRDSLLKQQQHQLQRANSQIQYQKRIKEETQKAIKEEKQKIQLIRNNFQKQKIQYETQKQQKISNEDFLLKQIYTKLREQYQLGYSNYVQTLDKAYQEKEKSFKKEEQQLKKSFSCSRSSSFLFSREVAVKSC